MIYSILRIVVAVFLYFFSLSISWADNPTHQIKNNYVKLKTIAIKQFFKSNFKSVETLADHLLEEQASGHCVSSKHVLLLAKEYLIEQNYLLKKHQKENIQLYSFFQKDHERKNGYEIVFFFNITKNATISCDYKFGAIWMGLDKNLFLTQIVKNEIIEMFKRIKQAIEGN